MRDSLRWGFNRVEKALDQDQKKLRIRVLSRRVEKGGRVGEGLVSLYALGSKSRNPRHRDYNLGGNWACP